MLMLYVQGLRGEGSSIGKPPTAEEVERLMEELENLSDSGAAQHPSLGVPRISQRRLLGGELDYPQDSVSIHSLPKPRLPPFFQPAASSRLSPAIPSHLVHPIPRIC